MKPAIFKLLYKLLDFTMMRVSKQHISLLFAVVFSLLISCEKNMGPDPGNGNGTVISEQTKYINNWIFDVMHEVYLWEEFIPAGLEPDKAPDPEKFFYEFVYDLDRFSWIYNDYDGLMGEYYGVQKSTGFSPAFGRINGSDTLFAVVEYVYRGSPADSAELKRGDIILEVDGQPLTVNTYRDILQTNTMTLTLGEPIPGGYKALDQKITVQPRVIAEDPAVHWEVLDVEGHRVGYLAYVSFTSGENDEYLYTLNTVFQEFASAGIKDMILDLRYNRGGDQESAGWLASGVCPAVNVSNRDVMIRFQWNAGYTAYFKQTEGEDSENLQFRFPANPYNLDLDRIFVFTTDETASASEFTITGLDPYMDVITIGDTTFGKYTGAWIIPDLADPPNHNWAMIPTVMKYANAEGFTEFNHGLPPDHAVDPYQLPLWPFGDPRDPMTAEALSLLTGQAPSAYLKREAAKPPVDWFDVPVNEFKRNLYLEPILK
jgi:C-terminal processing protease CtpA/Prc